MRNFFLIALLATGLSACAQSSGSNLDVSQVSQMILDKENIVLIDVRTPEEFQEGHLEGAKLINFYDANFQEEVRTYEEARALAHHMTHMPNNLHCEVCGKAKAQRKSRGKMLL